MLPLCNEVEAAPAGWSSGPVAQGSYAESSAAVDANGHVHLAFEDFTSNMVRYATNLNGSYVLQDIDLANGYWVSLDVDSNAKVHVIYYQQPTQSVRYATNAGGSWAIMSLANHSGPGWFNDIAVDTNDKVHAVYTNLTDGHFVYVTNAQGAWSYEFPDDRAVGSGNPAIDTDATDQPHISYVDTTHGWLVYAKRNGTSWASTVVDSAGNVQGRSDLLVDTTGKIHIAYYTSNNQVHYATNAGGAWSTEVVGTERPLLNSVNKIALDSANRPHIAFFDYVSGSSDPHVVYAEKVQGTWVSTRFDQWSWTPSIAIVPPNNLHIFYQDSSSAQQMLYANITLTVVASTIPSAPTSFQAVGGNGQVELSWSPPADNGGVALTGYKLYRTLTPGAYSTPLVTLSSGALSFIDTTVSNGQTYYYTVSALNSVGEGPKATERSATPSGSSVDPPGLVIGLKATTVGNIVTLSWTKPSTGGPVSGYRIFRSTTDSNPVQISEISHSFTSSSEILPSDDQTYYYWVAAYNSAGNGPTGSSVSAMAQPVGIGIVAILVIVAIVAVVAFVFIIIMIRRNKQGRL
jgi:hypothetical protein